MASAYASNNAVNGSEAARYKSPIELTLAKMKGRDQLRHLERMKVQDKEREL